MLRRDPGATLLTYREAVAELGALQPATWTAKKVEHLVTKLRHRLAAQGLDGVTPGPDDICHDDTYRRNLIEGLIRSGTLGVADLGLLDGDGDGDGDDDDEDAGDGTDDRGDGGGDADG